MNSRSLNDKAGVATYLAEVKSAHGPIRKSKTTSPADALIKRPTGSPTPSVVQPAPRKAPRKSTGLIPQNFAVDVETRALTVANELKRLPIKYATATAVTLRTLVELAAIGFLKEHHSYSEVEKHTRKPNGKPRPSGYCPTLKEMLRYIRDEFELDRHEKAALQKFLSKADVSLAVLNQNVHNPWTPPTEQELRAHWTNLTPLAQLLLQRPEN